jgi:hypothetical protein
VPTFVERPVLAQPAIDAERRVDELRLLHVDADELPVRSRVLDERRTFS